MEPTADHSRAVADRSEISAPEVVELDRLPAAGPTNGTWRVVGNAGSVPVHALPFTNELILFMQRADNSNGSSYDPSLKCELFLSLCWSHHLACQAGLKLVCTAYTKANCTHASHYAFVALICRSPKTPNQKWLPSTI